MKKLLSLLACVLLLTGCNTTPTNNQDQGLTIYSLNELDTLDYSKTYTYEEIEEYLEDKNDYFRFDPLSENETLRYVFVKMDEHQYSLSEAETLTYQIMPLLALEYAEGNTLPLRIVSIYGIDILHTGILGGNIEVILESPSAFTVNFKGNLYPTGDIKWSKSKMKLEDKTQTGMAIELMISNHDESQAIAVEETQSYKSDKLNQDTTQDS